MFRYKNVRDEDLFIDFKLDLTKEKEVAVFESMCNPKMPHDMDTLEREQWEAERAQWEKENGMMNLGD